MQSNISQYKLTDENRNKNGRGYTRHYYTVKDIARMSNRAEGTIRNAACSGKLNIDDLESVIDYCNQRRNIKVCRIPTYTP